MERTEQLAEEMSMALEFFERLARLFNQLMSAQSDALAELAEAFTVKPEPRMNTTMHISTHSVGKILFLTTEKAPKRCMMRQHTAATGA